LSALRTPAAARSRIVVALAVMVGLLVLPAVSASAAVSCTRNGTLLTVTMTGNDLAVISRGGGGELLVNGSQCGGSRVDNIDLVRIRGNAGAQTVVIDQTNGLLAPGATPEASGISEIEFDIQLGASLQDRLVVVGTPFGDLIAFGTGGVAVDFDNDADVIYHGVDIRIADGYFGNDFLTGQAGGGTGVPISSPLQLFGGPDEDFVFGGYGNDVVNGNDGDDFVWGGPGNDLMVGGPGSDTADYEFTNNAITASLVTNKATGDGPDTFQSIENLFGGKNRDKLTGDGGPNVIDGNGQLDRCVGNGGGDTIVDCEA
jgi:hypothetical protein